MEGSNSNSKQKEVEQSTRCADLESVMERVGSFGKYQKLMTLLLCIPFTFNWSLNYWIHYLIIITPPHQCAVPDLSPGIASTLIPLGLDGQPDSCHRYNVSLSSIRGMDANQTEVYLKGLEAEGMLGKMSCDNGWDYDLSADFRTTIVDYDWVCDNQWKKYTTTTMFFAGMLIGLITFGIMSDRYGRLPVCIVANILSPVASFLCIFCTNFYMFSAARFLMGLTENCNYMMPFILVMEYLPPRARGLVSPLTFSVFPTLVNGSLPWVTLWIGSWSSALLYTSILTFALAVPALFFMPESTSWMLTHDQVERSYETIQKIAKFNGVELSQKESDDIEDDLYAIRREIQRQPKVDMKQLIKSRNVCIRFGVCICLSIITNILYDATVRNLELLPVSLYTTFTLFASLFIPSQIFSYAVMNRFGRRPTIMISMAITCALNSLIAFVNLESLSVYVIAGILLTTQFFNIVSFATHLTLMSELLPTVIRARAISIASCAAAMALTVSPQIIHLGTTMKGLPSIVFATVAFVGMLLETILPETLGQSLPQTLEDGERLGESYGDEKKGQSKESC